VRTPAHFTHVNQTFNTWLNLNKCTVIGYRNYFTVDFGTFQNISSQVIPWVRSQLLQSQRNTLLQIIVIQNNHLDTIIQLQHLFWVVDTTPRDICNVQQTIDTAQIYEHTERSHVFHNTFQYLSFFQFRQNHRFLCFDIVFNQGFVRYHYILIDFIDFHNFEIHVLTYVLIVITYRLCINL